MSSRLIGSSLFPSPPSRISYRSLDLPLAPSPHYTGHLSHHSPFSSLPVFVFLSSLTQAHHYTQYLSLHFFISVFCLLAFLPHSCILSLSLSLSPSLSLPHS